ncbi:hypothetical protein OG618_32395 [Kitasatospora sp. NBC_01246]|uniref:hypothetical protein n=1 Tax=Kitasatospora sp. NBC_01246 TaxID=2903570 RepID=UPI002E3046CF|nr:hypothetical protein [Kitasatospora sp. NBC_01246]
MTCPGCWKPSGCATGYPPETARPQYGILRGERALAASRACLGAFFDQHLLGRPSALLNGPSADYPEVRFVK